MRITVIGCGYLGATHAACMAELGFEVLGVEIDPAKREGLMAGRVPFYEPGLQELLTKHVETGRLRFTDSAQEAAEFGDVHFICVGTPQLPESLGADLGQVDGAVELLGPHLTRPTVVVGKSTVPVGTAPRLSARLAELAPAGADAELVWNPEFLREGFAVEDTLRPNRLVIGGASAHAEKLLREVYADALGHGVPLVVTDYATAELVKASANAFLATKISFINAVAEMCEVTGADVVDLADALGHDDRIGRKFLNAGHRLRRRLPAQGHPGVPAPRGRARRGRHDDLPAPHRRDQPEPARARRQHRHLDARRLPGRRADRGVGSGVQARQRRRTRLPRPLDRRSAAPARRPGEHLRPEGRRDRAARCSPR